MTAIAITGTSTGVGKTTVACALAASAADRGVRVHVLKPIETGVAAFPPADDAARLKEGSRSDQSIEAIAPYRLAVPLAPLAAARIAGTAIDLAVLDAAFETAKAGADLLIVEGAGGLLVPITREESFASLFARWRLPVVIVAANRLGVINHALLTVRAAEAAGLSIAGIAINEIPPAERDASSASNALILSELLPRIPMWHFPWMAPPIDEPRAIGAVRRWNIEFAGGLPHDATPTPIR
jgi:dethiobiotin synthetase